MCAWLLVFYRKDSHFAIEFDLAKVCRRGDAHFLVQNVARNLKISKLQVIINRVCSFPKYCIAKEFLYSGCHLETL